MGIQVLHTIISIDYLTLTCEGDDWVVQCENNTGHTYSQDWKSFTWNTPFHTQRVALFHHEIHKYWRPDTPFRLYHVHSRSYLSFTNEAFVGRTCLSCAEQGISEVSTIKLVGDSDPATLDVRWYTKHMLHIPFPCLPTGRVASLVSSQLKRPWNTWPIHLRELRAGDFVAWRDRSSNPCNNLGNTHIGFVVEIVPASKMVTVDEWAQITPNHYWIQHYRSLLPHEKQMLPRRVFPKTMLYGPLQHKRAKVDSQEGLQRNYVKFYIWHAGVTSLYSPDIKWATANFKHIQP